MNKKDYIALGIIVSIAIIAGVAGFFKYQYGYDYKPIISEPASLESVLNSTFTLEDQGTYSDPKNLTWKEATLHAPWNPRDSQVALAFKDSMWLFGGLEGGRGEYWQAPHKNDIWVSKNGKDWALVRAEAEWPSMRSMSIEEFQGKLWLFGGWSTTHGYKNWIWNSSDAINWTEVKKNVEWNPREGQASVVFQGKLWMMGGVRYKNGQQLLNDVWSSEDGLTWTKVTEHAEWFPRYDHAVAVFNNRMYLVGGLRNGKAVNDVWSSVDGKTWVLENGNAPWEERHGLTVLPYKNRLWIISGWGTINEAGTQDIWYSSNGKDWEKTAENIPWVGREDHSAFVYKDRIWVLGGMGPFWKWNNDVWYSSF